MADSKPLIVRVAVPSPLRRTFDYLVPDNLQSTPPLRGCRVSIPFGKRHVVGLVIDCVDTSAFSIDKLKPIAAVIDQQPLLPESLFKLFIWAANYYQHPIGDALHSTLPVLLRRATPTARGQPCTSLATEFIRFGAWPRFSQALSQAKSVDG